MKKRSFGLEIVVICTVMLFGTFVHAEQFQTRGKFIPLKVGQTFVFEVVDGIGNYWEEVLAVNGITIIPSLRYNFFMLDIVGSEEPNDEPSIFNVRSTKDKMYGYQGFGNEIIVWQDAPVGTTWTYEEYDGITKATIEAIETVSVPAGIFEGCLKIHKRCINCDDPAPEWIEWVKPGFFMVKWIDYWTDNPPKMHELESWHGN